jgi:aspartate racemase
VNANRLKRRIPGRKQKAVLGVLGGLGPLASADFLMSIYDYNLGKVEQHSPSVIMFSDPTFPDRTELFLRGSDDVLLELLTEALEGLCKLDVSKIVIACITIHYLLTRLPVHLQSRVISLIDVALAKAIESGRKHLLICTTGTRAMGIFQKSAKWPEAEGYVVLPDAEDQEAVHDQIYRLIKKNKRVECFIPFLESLLDKYEVSSFIAGCTEMHRVTRYLALNNAGEHKLDFIDPLLAIAKNYKEFVHEYEEHSGDAVRSRRKIRKQGRNQLHRHPTFVR